MKKIARILASLVTITSLTLVPVAVHAQTSEDIIEVGGDTTTTLPETGGETVPTGADTGIAPSNKVIQNTAVFVGGSLIGVGLGFGIVTLRKKQNNL